MATVLEDGRYDVVVVDVIVDVVVDVAADATPADAGSCRVELTILAGPHKGEIVGVRRAGLADRALDLLGIPATLTVTGGVPTVRFEP